MPLTNDLRDEYESRFANCKVRAERAEEIENTITHIMKSRPRYEAVSAVTRVPWYVIAIIHNMECGGSFDCHLHNGDPLRERTVRQPPGRPLSGDPPFTWEASAIDALEYDGFDVWRDWSVAGTLYKLELYNGFGYRARKVPTPYLWSATQFYDRGKFVEVKVAPKSYKVEFNPYLVSKQIGAAAILRRMADQHLIDLGLPTDEKCAGVS